jgi:hypothetical protein
MEFLPNVKDEPRHRPARLVPHYDYILWIHFGLLSEARGVTDGGVASGALLGIFCLRQQLSQLFLRLAFVAFLDHLSNELLGFLLSLKITGQI